MGVETSLAESSFHTTSSWPDLSSAYMHMLRQVYKQPTRVSTVDPVEVKRQPDNYKLNRSPYREILHVDTVIRSPSETERITTRCPVRNRVMREYFEKEAELFDQGDCQGLTQLSRVWDKIKDPETGRVHSNYGYMVYHLRDIGTPTMSKTTPWEWAKQRLILCEDTNQAVLLFLRPFHQYETNLDQPCTCFVQFVIRDGQLHLFANMRSNDICFGSPYNLMYFTRMMHRMVRELHHKYPPLRVGNLVHRVTSLHMYEKHQGLVANMIGS